MNIPPWIWPALAVACLLALSEYECWQINRKRDFMRDVEAERIARANAHPLGNAHRVYDRERDAA